MKKTCIFCYQKNLKMLVKFVKTLTVGQIQYKSVFANI